MVTKQKKVLIISYYFPPEKKIAALRVGKFSKYLPDFGWQPIVLTTYVNEDGGSLPEISNCNIYRTSHLKFIRRIRKKYSRHNPIMSDNETSSCPGFVMRCRERVLTKIRDILILPIFRMLFYDGLEWCIPAVLIGKEIIKKFDVDVIFSSYSPASSHIIASILHKQTGVPWIADFRDMWSLNNYVESLEPLSSIEHMIEKRTIRGSSLLTTISTPLAEELSKFHSKHAITITNGFDEEDYVDSVPLTAKFSITYTGEIYASKRDPTPLFEAICLLRKEGLVSPDNFEVRFYGLSVHALSPLIEKYSLQQLVKINGHIPLKDSIKRQKESTILLLLSWNDPRDRGVLTGKLFEYFGAKRPILAIGSKDSVLHELLTSTGCGILTSDCEEIFKVLSVWLIEFNKSGDISSHFTPIQKQLLRYTRKEKARDLANALNLVLQK